MEKTLQNQKTKLWKRILSIVLAVIIGFGTFVVFTFGNSRFQKWLGINSVLSAYAAEMVDTKGAVAVDEEAMLADDHTINLENKDGSNTVYLFSEPISYTDENGILKPKTYPLKKRTKSLNQGDMNILTDKTIIELIFQRTTTQAFKLNLITVHIR